MIGVHACMRTGWMDGPMLVTSSCLSTMKPEMPCWLPQGFFFAAVRTEGLAHGPGADVGWPFQDTTSRFPGVL